MIQYKKCYLHMGYNEQYVCIYKTCQHKLICSQCLHLHKTIHSEQFIYKFEKLLDIHKLNKFAEIKKLLINGKLNVEQIKKKKIQPLNGYKKLQQYVQQCKQQIISQIDEKLNNQIHKDKQIILKYEKTVQKSDLYQPQNMITLIVQQIIKESQIADQCKKVMKQQLRNLNQWIRKSLEQLVLFDEQMEMILQSVKRRKDEILKKFSENFTFPDKINHLDLGEAQQINSFEKRYTQAKRMNWQNHRLSCEIQKLNKKMMTNQNIIGKYENQTRGLMEKIYDLQIQIEQLNKRFSQAQLRKNQQKLSNQQSQKQQKKIMNEFLLKKGVHITSDPKQINLPNKNLKFQQLAMICKNLPKLLHLDISQNKFDQSQLQVIYQFTQLISLKLNFMKITPKFIESIPNNFKRLQALHLNSNQISDDSISDLSKLKLKQLSLVDNNITDIGIQIIANNFQNLKKLYLSYNRITSKSLDVVTKFLFKLQVFHITRNKIKNKGALQIAKNLKQLVQLFIGGNEISKEGVLPIARNNFKIQRLSMGQNNISSDAIVQIIMYLNDLVWLDISYNKLNELQVEKIFKMARTNQKLVLISEQL